MRIPTDAEILKEFVRRFGQVPRTLNNPPIRSYKYVDDLFPEQRSAADDPSDFAATYCSRRAGKTHTIAARQIRTCESRSYARCPYIGITRRSAERIYLPKLEWFKEKYGLDMEINYSKLEFTFPKTKSQIFIVGADKKHEIEKLRGEAYDDAAVDEAQSFGAHLKQLIDDVLEPATIDRRGKISLWGTPNAACVGFFHDATNKVNDVEGYSVHNWTLINNPWINDPASWLANLRLKKGWTEDHPTYMREYLGLWVRSMDSLVYRFREERNCIDSIDHKGFNHVLGVDLGTKDAFAIGVLGCTENSPDGYALDCFKQSDLTISDMARKILELRDIYEPVAIVADTGGLGKAIVDEMNERFGLNIQPAEKKSKKDYIELMNADFESGRFKVVRSTCKEYIDEVKVLQWDEDRKKEDERYENDVADAFLYGFRELKHWTHTPKIAEPSIHSEASVNKWWEKEAEKAKTKANEEWWEREV